MTLTGALEHLSLLPPDEAESEFLKCCGSRRWAREMTEARPFKSLDELLSKADLVCSSLREEDWLEAFHAHPKIGEQKAAAAQSEQARNWAQREQSGMESAAAATRAALAAGNQEYEKRFGFIFIVCATGKTPEEMLAILNGRLKNEPGSELKVAAEEQRKITRLRLEKLLNQ